MRGGARFFILLVVAAAALASACVLLAFGLPLLARGALGAGGYVAGVALAALVSAIVSGRLLHRGVAVPVERILVAAESLRWSGREPGLPLAGEGGATLPRAALAFERVAVELVEERARLAAKVGELTRANEELAAAQQSLVRAERLATVGRLAAGLAHEVGNPLGAITGYVELARSRLPPDADPELAGALDRIAAAAERIDRTVRGLLDFARPAAPTLARVPLGAAIEGALRLARVQPRFRRVDVEVALPPDLPAVVADELHLQQVLLNLLLNAGDAMQGQGRVRLRAEAERVPEHGAARVRLHVADEGPGIPAADLGRIFEPFFTTKEAGQGTGLGLAISQHIVESFGGRLDAGNGERGAVFVVDLIAAEAAP